MTPERPPGRESRPATNRAADISTAIKTGSSIPPWGSRRSIWHGRECTPVCRELAVPSPLGRETPPLVACPHCGVPAGVACLAVRSSRYRTPLARFGRFHPSRLKVAAA